jgi:hypothetical protein
MAIFIFRMDGSRETAKALMDAVKDVPNAAIAMALLNVFVPLKMTVPLQVRFCLNQMHQQ